MTDAELLLVFDSTIDPSGIAGWAQHFDSTGTTTTTYRLGGAHVMVAQGPGALLPLPADLPGPGRRRGRAAASGSAGASCSPRARP